jgi:DNA replication protein DnaC
MIHDEVPCSLPIFVPDPAMKALVERHYAEAESKQKENQEETIEEGECNIHGKYKNTVITLYGRQYGPSCPICEQEQEENLEMEREKEEARQKEEGRKRRMVRQNIEPAFEYSTLENFDATTEEQKHNLEKVRALISGEIKKIVMTGKNGTGKTHLACAAIHALGGKIMTMYEISTTIRASYIKDSDEDELAIVDGYARLPLFVIDEIGRTKGSDTEANWLSYIIDKRHVRGLPTILISNKHTRKTCPNNGCADCLENYIGEDIMSRLCEDGMLLKFTGDDYRKRR